MIAVEHDQASALALRTARRAAVPPSRRRSVRRARLRRPPARVPRPPRRDVCGVCPGGQVEVGSDRLVTGVAQQLRHASPGPGARARHVDQDEGGHPRAEPSACAQAGARPAPGGYPLPRWPPPMARRTWRCRSPILPQSETASCRFARPRVRAMTAARRADQGPAASAAAASRTSGASTAVVSRPRPRIMIAPPRLDHAHAAADRRAACRPGPSPRPARTPARPRRARAGCPTARARRRRRAPRTARRSCRRARRGATARSARRPSPPRRPPGVSRRRDRTAAAGRTRPGWSPSASASRGRAPATSEGTRTRSGRSSSAYRRGCRICSADRGRRKR